MKGILLDEQTGDLLIENGSMVVGDNTAQVAQSVLTASRGEFKEFPLIGGEVVKMQNGIPDPMWCADVKRMLNFCGVPASRVYFDGNEIKLE